MINVLTSYIINILNKMNLKYEKFIKYNWNDCPEWRTYLYNIYPSPDSTKIMHFRKRFYRLKVDPEFDPTYIPQTECTHSHQCTDHIKTHIKHKSIKKGILESLIAALEGFLWVAFIFNMLIRANVLPLSFIALTMRLFRIKNISLNINLLSDELIQLAIYSLLLLFDNINYLLLFPLSVTALYCICDYFTNYMRIFLFLKKYFEYITRRNDELNTLKAFSFVLIGIYMIPAVMFGVNHIIFAVFIWGYLYYLNRMNVRVEFTVYKIKEAIRKSRRVPELIKKFL